MSRLAPVALLVWECADWQLIERLFRQGRLPTLHSLFKQGIGGSLRASLPLHPMASLASLYTGHLVSGHGVIGDEEIVEGRLRPVRSDSLQAPPIWQILAGRGRSVAALNAPLSYPVVDSPAMQLGEPFFRPGRGAEGLMPVPAASLAPPAILAEVDELRLHAADLEAAELLSLAPGAAQVDQASDQRLALLSVKLAETITTQNSADWCLRRQRPDFFCLRYSWLDLLGRVFPVTVDANDPFAGLIERALEMLDLMLGHLCQRLGPEATVLVVSPHAISACPPRPDASVDSIYRPQGFVVAAGPSVKAGQTPLGASVLDIVPTLLALAELPLAQDMPGRALGECFELSHRIRAVASWGSSLAPVRSPADETLLDGLRREQLRPSASTVQALEFEQTLATATALAETGQTEPALAMLEAADSERLHQSISGLRTLAHLRLDLNQLDNFEEGLTALMRAGGTDFDQHLLLARWHGRQGQSEKALEALFDALSQHPEHPLLHVFIGEEYRRLNRLDDALTAYQHAIGLDPTQLRALLGKGDVLIQQGRHAEAVEAALDAIACCFNAAMAHQQLGRALQGLAQWADAAEAYQASLRLAPGLVDSHRALLELYGPDGLDQPDQLRAQRALYARVLADQSLRASG